MFETMLPADQEVLAKHYLKSPDLADITDTGETNELLGMVKKVDPHGTSRGGQAAVGQAFLSGSLERNHVTASHLAELARGEDNRAEDDKTFMSSRQRKLLKRSRTENDDAVEIRRETKRIVRRSLGGLTSVAAGNTFE